MLFRYGFDLTDESFYVLNFRWWKDFEFLVSYFGAYLSPLFTLAGENIYLMRIAGGVMLALSSIYFAYSLTRNLGLDNSPRTVPWTVLAAAISGSFCYYIGLRTLYTPSYNLLSLVLLLVTTGLTLDLRREGNGFGKQFIYLLLIGALFWVKSSSAVTAVALHGLIRWIDSRSWLKLAAHCGLLAIGILVNGALLSLANGNALSRLRAGTSYYLELSPRHLADALPFLASVPYGLARTVPLFALIVVLARLFKRHSGIEVNIASMAILVLSALFFSIKATSLGYIAVCAALISLLYIHKHRPAWQESAKLALICIMPFGYGIGSTNNLFLMNAMALVFPLTVLGLVVSEPFSRFRRPDLMIPLCALIITLVPLSNLLKPWFQAKWSHRLMQPLRDMETPLDFTGSLLVDASTADSVNTMTQKLKLHGFRPGEPMLEFSGHTPGLVLAAGGRPLGTAWLLGGYDGSHRAAQRLLERLPEEDVARAWLLVEPNGNESLPWMELAPGRLNPRTHRRVDSFQFPDPLAPGKSRTVEIWAPTDSQPYKP